jgi:hypothetical protein
VYATSRMLLECASICKIGLNAVICWKRGNGQRYVFFFYACRTVQVIRVIQVIVALIVRTTTAVDAIANSKCRSYDLIGVARVRVITHPIRVTISLRMEATRLKELLRMGRPAGPRMEVRAATRLVVAARPTALPLPMGPPRMGLPAPATRATAVVVVALVPAVVVLAEAALVQAVTA